MKDRYTDSSTKEAIDQKADDLRKRGYIQVPFRTRLLLYEY
jgi:hypothetical protein